jgi:hypothetical protein
MHGRSPDLIMRDVGVALVTTGLFASGAISQVRRMRAAYSRARTTFWSSLDRPGPLLVYAGIALLDMSSRARAREGESSNAAPI